MTTILRKATVRKALEILTVQLATKILLQELSVQTTMAGTGCETILAELQGLEAEVGPCYSSKTCSIPLSLSNSPVRTAEEGDSAMTAPPWLSLQLSPVTPNTSLSAKRIFLKVRSRSTHLYKNRLQF